MASTLNGSDMLLAFCHGPASNTELIPKEYTWEQLAQRMAKPSIGPKNGSYLLRGGVMSEYTRENEHLLEAELLIIDGDSSFDPETGEVFMAVDPDDGKLKGNSTPIEVARDALDRLGYKYTIHTTHTNTPGILNKWRAFIPAKMKSPAELEASVEYVIGQMHAQGCYVESNKESKTWAQAWYLPRVKPQYADSYKCFASLVGSDVDVATAVNVAKRQKAAAEAAAQRQEAPKPKTPLQGPSPIEMFNGAATMATVKYMLEQSGYKFAYRRGDSMRFIAPGSESGTPGVTVFKGTKRGDICAYSHHGAHDPLSGRLNDAFGMLTRLRHAGNQEQALAEAKAVVGWASKRHGGDLEGFETEILPEDFEKAPRIAPAGLPGQERAWQSGLLTTAKGVLLWNAYNATAVLRNHEEWAGVFAFDGFTGRPCVLRDFPGNPTRDVFPRDIRDTDYTIATCWFNENGFPLASKNIVADAIDTVCLDAVMHPVRDYLNSLSWDGTPRLKTWLRQYCAAEVKDEEHGNYVDEAGFRWMISAVARVMRPGCKADSALIIEGEQGCGKSSLIRILGGPDWFGDSLPTFGTKDSSSYLRGRWIIELAELSNVSKSEVEEIKAFITRTEERYRPAYGRNEIVFQRQCVFAGTTNASSYLRDETGNRRFWPVRVGTVDLEGLALDRDQLWAEAVTRFKAGDQWHLPAGVYVVSEREQVDRHMEDPWTGRIVDYLFGKNEAAISDIAINGLGFDVSRVSRADANRIVGILRLLGWDRDGRFMDRASGRRNMARYINKHDKGLM